MERAIKSILEKVKFSKDDVPHFPKKSYAPVKISKENFHKIKNVDSNKKIAFIDGGNQEIIGSANFSLQYVRVYSCVYQYNKRISRETFEAYAFIFTEKKDGELEYSVKLYPAKEKVELTGFSFGLYDESLKVGVHKVSIGSIGDTARKFLEIMIAKKVCNDADVVVMDGDLEATVTGEKKIMDELYASGATICALSKTTTLLTENGNSVAAILSNIGPSGVWHYNPLVKIDNPNHDAEMFLVKLHENSKHIFRLDVHDAPDIDEILSALIKNSKDPVFLGYPYGLVEADRFARVGNKETEMLKTKAIVKLGKDFEKIRAHLSAKNAHDILDSIG